MSINLHLPLLLGGGTTQIIDISCETNGFCFTFTELALSLRSQKENTQVLNVKDYWNNRPHFGIIKITYLKNIVFGENMFF